MSNTKMKKAAKHAAKVKFKVLDAIQKYYTKHDLPYLAQMEGGGIAADGGFQIKIFVSYPPED